MASTRSPERPSVRAGVPVRMARAYSSTMVRRASRSVSAGATMSPERYDTSMSRRASVPSSSEEATSTPRSNRASRWLGLRSSQTRVRFDPPMIVVRILTGESQLTCTWAIAPVLSRSVR